MSGKRMKKNKINIRKIFLLVLFIAIMFGVVPALSKYKGATAEQIITILTRYSVNYRTSGGVIAEPEKFNSYVSQTGLTLPVEGEVTRTSYDFLGWYGDNDFTGEPVTKIESGETGDKLFFAAWQLAQYDLNVKVKDTDGNITSGLPSDYYIVIGKDEQGNDNVIDLDGKGTTTVGKYQTISIKTIYYEDMTLGGFTFLDSNGEEIEIEITTRHQDGDQYIYYDFKMPRGNTTLLFTKENTYVDISKSPITFEENVSIDGTSTTQSGFWYNGTITGMTPIKTDVTKGRFYAWDYSEPFYVTSKGKETQNQLTLANAITVYFKDCKLVARDGIDMSGRKVNGQSIEGRDVLEVKNILGDTLTEYGNIIINKDIVNNYTVNFYIEGNNTITTIFPNVYNYTISYEGTINIYGKDEGELYLGTVLDNANISFSGVNLKEITEFESEYFLYIANVSERHGKINFNYCTINIPNKRIYTYRGGIGYYSKVNLVSTTPTIADIGSSRQYNFTYLSGNSSLHVRNDLMGTYTTLDLSGNSTLIVDGNILSTYSHWSSGAYINTSGYVIVKGNRFDGENMTLRNGTVITNLLELGRTCNMTGGTVVTNLISNPVCLQPVVNENGEYINSNDSGIEKANNNDDDTPFLTMSSSDSTAGIYEFGGSNIYILGNYKLLETGTYRYDTSVKATDYDELNNVMEQLIENGKISTYPEMRESSNENIIIGNSRDVARYNVRTVKISGGNIYASGDITFFNDVAVTGGNINCTGIFSTKRNLGITGGTINAKEIGNSYNLTNTNNGLNYCKTTTITGGTLKTERLGATSKTINTTGSNGTLIINGSVQINSETQIVTDTYINYVYDSNTFNNSNTVNNIRFSGAQGAGTMNNIDKLEIISPTLENDQYEFSKPTVNGVEQKWKYKSLNGIELEYLSKYGYINGDTSNSNIYQDTQLNLYATKEKYNLTVHGSNYSGTSNGENIDFTKNIAEIKSGNQVILRITENLIDKVVVWYKDNSGTIYNAIEKEEDINKENATITFNMPSADTEVWIVDGTEIESLTLDLSAYNVSILADGFATELNENRRDSSVFKYNGDITIAQSNIEGTYYVNRYNSPVAPISGNYNDKVTYNKITVEGTNANKIVLKNIIQNTIDEEEYAVIIEENVEVNLLVDGAIQLKSIKLPGTSILNITGENEHDVLNIKYTGGTSGYRQISNSNGKVGSVSLKNLTIHQCQRGRIVYNNNYNKTEYLNIEDCIYENNFFYAYSGIAKNVDTVNIINSIIKLNNADSWPDVAFNEVNSLNIIGGSIENNNLGAQYNSYSFLYSVNKAKLTNTVITENLRNSVNTNVYYHYFSINILPTTVTLNGNTQINSNYRYIFRDKLILNDTSSVNIGDDTTPGYLFAPNIEVNGQAQINSANVILSGYYNPISVNNEATTKSDVMKKLSTNTEIKDGTGEFGLVLNEGTVNAKEFVGGDVNATITINDGTMNASKIGTIGSLFGYARYVPKVGEEYVYTYSKIPEKGTKVTVNGGTVNVLENGYLGGMNAEVDIKGGTVNLQNDSIIGMTDSDTTKLVNSITTQGNTPNELVDINITGGKIVGETGKINTAYSTLDIDATTSNPNIKIAEIIAENGTVNIQSTADNYDNPLGEGEKVGAVINENLIAQNISISNGASVYAKNAITRTNTSSAKGSLKVGANSYLYTLHYGSEGSGTSTITNNGTIVGNRQYTIKYEMNDTYSDKAENTNPVSYIYGNTVTLVEPTRTGYNFEGWYDENGNRVTEITSTDSGDKVFYAKWTEKFVEFVVKIKASDVGISKDEFAKQVDTNLGTLNANGDEFTYTQKVSIKYHALFNTGFLLSNYNLNSYSASGAKINNTTLNPDGDVLNLTSSGMTVTKEIMDYYIANKNEPIEILVCEFISNDVKTIDVDE